MATFSIEESIGDGFSIEEVIVDDSLYIEDDDFFYGMDHEVIFLFEIRCFT